MSSIVSATNNDVKLRKDTHGFWEKVSQLYHAEEKPTYSKNRKLYNFAIAILSPSKPENKHILCPQQGKDVLKDLKQYAGLKKYDVLTRLYQFKGWEYKARQQAKLSAEAPTPSKLKLSSYIEEDVKMKEFTELISALELEEVEAFKNRDTNKAKALSKQRIKVKQQKEKRVSLLISQNLKKEKKIIIKQMDKLVVEYPTATDERRQEMNEEMDQSNARLAEIKKELTVIEESETKKKKKKLSAQQDEPEYKEFINEELDEFLRTKNSTNNFSVSIAIDKKGNLYCDYDSVNNTMGKKFGTYNRATGKWKLYKSYLKILGTNPEKTQAELIKSLTEQDDDEEDDDEEDENDDTNCNINEPNNIGEMCEVTDIRNTKNFLVPEFEVENKSGKKISSVDILSTEITDNFLIKLNVEVNEATQKNDDEKKGDDDDKKEFAADEEDDDGLSKKHQQDDDVEEDYKKKKFIPIYDDFVDDLEEFTDENYPGVKLFINPSSRHYKEYIWKGKSRNRVHYFGCLNNNGNVEKDIPPAYNNLNYFRIDGNSLVVTHENSLECDYNFIVDDFTHEDIPEKYRNPNSGFRSNQQLNDNPVGFFIDKFGLVWDENAEFAGVEKNDTFFLYDKYEFDKQRSCVSLSYIYIC